MIGDRVRWAYRDQHGQPMFPERAGVVRGLSYSNSQWRVLVQGRDGQFFDELAMNYEAVEPGTPADALERELAEARTDLATDRDTIRALAMYIRSEDLVSVEVLQHDPCGAAIELLQTFKAELLAVGAARDAAETKVKEALELYHKTEEAVSTAIAERDAALKRADELAIELEAAKKPKAGGRNRPPERLG